MRVAAALCVGLLVGAYWACAPTPRKEYSEFKAGDRCRWITPVGDFECRDAHTMLACDNDAGTFYEIKCLDDAGCWSNLDPPQTTRCYGAVVKLGEPCTAYNEFDESICSDDGTATVACLANVWSTYQHCTAPQRCVIGPGPKVVGRAYARCE